MKKVLQDQLNNTFIRGYEVPNTLCDEIIQVFYETGNKVLGTIGTQNKIGLDRNIKESVDIGVNQKLIDQFPCLKKYTDYLFSFCNDYINSEFTFCVDVNNSLGIKENFNIQWYPPGGGYKTWHCERNNLSNEPFKSRKLVFMTYLNDVKEERVMDGGTEFFYQNLSIKAIKGLTLIWPVEWMYTHRGIVAPTKEKIITTGWFSYMEESHE